MKAICKNCGKEFSIKPSGTKRGDGQHCSLACRYPPEFAERQFLSRFKKDESGCWPWTGSLSTNGYGLLRVNRVVTRSHRFSYELFNNTTIPPGAHVLHTCDNPMCVNPEHLFLGTHLDNMQDKMRKGRHVAPKGIANKNSKLSAQDVIDIRARFAAGECRRSIARSFGIDFSTVFDIANRITWKHI